MTERLVIARLGSHGEGVAETAAGPRYVPYSLPGETVQVAPWTGHPDRAHLATIENASAERITPICPHFSVCGGCAVQHLASSSYREWKRGLVLDALASAGLQAAVDPLREAHGEGRRRAVFHARHGAHDVIAVGFAALKAHQVVAIDHCPILAPGLAGSIKAAWAIAEALGANRKPLDIQVTATDCGLDVDVRGSGPLTALQQTELARVGEGHRLARLTRHGEIVAQRTAPILRIGRAEVALPPGAFLQATAAGEATLAALVQEHCAGAKRIADLFCGVGPFALRLAEGARVTAADADGDAIAALVRAARNTAGLKPLDAQTRDLFRRPLSPPELNPFDAVVLDPPRQGAQAQAEMLAQSDVPRVVAVSCNPATFARDARILVGGGYRLQRVTPIDQFLYSPHVELVGLFEKIKPRTRRS